MAKKGPSSPPKTTSRRPGAPRKNEPVVTPAVLEEMADMWLRGISVRRIAERFGVHHSTVAHHLEHHIRPRWQEALRSNLAEDLAKVALVERIAWERFEVSTGPQTRRQIKQALLDGQAEPQVVERVLTKITKSGEVAWLQVIQWCLDFRARIHAHYAPSRHRVDLGGELRVAGMGPSEVDQAMLERLMEKIAERRRYQASLGAGAN